MRAISFIFLALCICSSLYAQVDCRYNKNHVLAAGGFHSLYIDNQSAAKSFGFGMMGQLGTNSLSDKLSPVSVDISRKMRAVAAGTLESLFLDSDGKVWQISYDSAMAAYMVSMASVDSFMTGISVGGYHKLLLGRDGNVYSWGFGYYGQLGHGDRQNVGTPKRISSLGSIHSISSGGMHTLAVDGDGRIWSFGLGAFGQLGLGDANTSQYSPAMITYAAQGRFVAAAAGNYHSLALDENGFVYSFGNGYSGQLGLGDANISRSMPTRISYLPTIKAVAAGAAHSLALDTNGNVWAFGNNSSGQLGLGSYTSTNIPTQIPTLSQIVAISAGGRHSLALDKNGQVWSFGDNGNGQLGNGSTIASSLPVLVATNAPHFDYSYPYAPESANCTYQNTFGW